MKKLYIYIVLISLGVFTSCIEEITPGYEFEEQVFISGLLTNQAGLVSVQIQNTVKVTDSNFSAVNNAQVSLFTRNTNNTVSLVSDSFIVTNGMYSTSDIITPITGNTYWIEVILEDETVLKSEEELLKSSLPIIDMVKTDDIVQITFTNEIEEQNFYLIRLEVLKDDESISDDWYVFNDTVLIENSEEFNEINIGNINDGDSVRVSVHNINFNTFQFYYNFLTGEVDLSLSFFSPPKKIIGNVTNTTTNELVLGNFGIAGFSTMTMDF